MICYRPAPSNDHLIFSAKRVTAGFQPCSLLHGFSISSHVSQSEPAGSWVLIDFNVGY